MACSNKNQEDEVNKGEPAGDVDLVEEERQARKETLCNGGPRGRGGGGRLEESDWCDGAMC